MGNKSFVFRFADVEVREREFTLIKAGKALTVEPKAFRALLFLLHNPQRLISKEELLNSLWGDAAITQGSLTRCIWLLRRLLEDDIHEPRLHRNRGHGRIPVRVSGGSLGGRRIWHRIEACQR
jgi:DNA-binding winged helix-turn-helix (wHTH) protein